MTPINTVDSPLMLSRFSSPDPFGPNVGLGLSFVNAVTSTALFRCWHLLMFFGAWSALITILNEQGHKLYVQSTLLTVVGTVLGFVISYRTTSSFERYNEGRRYWSQVVLANRTFARTTWFHIPDPASTKKLTAEEQTSRSMIEKKSVINLLEAFAVSLKHYLRGEDGIYYQDLYYLVKHLPTYTFPPGRPSKGDAGRPSFSEGFSFSTNPLRRPFSLTSSSRFQSSTLYQRSCVSAPDLSPPNLLPAPVTSPTIHPLSLTKTRVHTESPQKPTFLEPSFHPPLSSPETSRAITNLPHHNEKVILPREDEKHLFPAYTPPKYHWFDLFPLSLLSKVLTKKGRDVKGKKAARLRARLRKDTVSSGNLPLEISLYLSSYIAALQARKQTDVPTLNTLIAALNQLVDALTGLERILTTPIPFSYSFHLWAVTAIYCLALPFQIWQSLKWITVPGTVILAFIFFGFLVAGEEIENPFGYDKNDLNLDHFTNNIIRAELRAITSAAPPNPSDWAFSPENDLLFATKEYDLRLTPKEWMERGHVEMQKALSGLI